MVGNMAKSIYGNLAGTLSESWSVGMKGGMRMLIVMADANEMYGQLL
jgi:hypothetical protein